MIEIINSHDRERLAAKLRHVRECSVVLDAGLMSQVQSIIDDVRRRGDVALIDYANRFDGCVMRSSELRIGEDELDRIAANADRSVVAALTEAIGNVRRFHEYELQESWEIETADGVRMGQRITAIERAGLYVPGGTASYPSSVVMNVVPAQVAGVVSNRSMTSGSRHVFTAPFLVLVRPWCRAWPFESVLPPAGALSDEERL